MAKNYLICASSFHQYAEGVTGINRSQHWFGKTGEIDYPAFNSISYTLYTDKINPEEVCFRTKGEAREYCKANGIKAYSHKGHGDCGYGDVGARSRSIYIIDVNLKESRW